MYFPTSNFYVTDVEPSTSAVIDDSNVDPDYSVQGDGAKYSTDSEVRTTNDGDQVSEDHSINGNGVEEEQEEMKEGERRALPTRRLRTAKWHTQRIKAKRPCG